MRSVDMDTPIDSSPAAKINPFSCETLPSGLFRWFPGLVLFKTYKRSWLIKDIVAGLVLTTVLVPVGMGYAEASGVPAICGLYATMVALVAYAIFGRSRILVVGPDSALVAIIAATILPMATRGSVRAMELASVLAIVSGAVCVLAGVSRFGFITDLLSKPIRFGYLNAIALTVIVGQLSVILGFRANSPGLIPEIKSLANCISTGPINWCAFAIGMISLTFILIAKRWLPRVPIVFLIVLATSMLVTVFDLVPKTGISVVGALPAGLPGCMLPSVSMQELTSLVVSGIAIAFVSFADMSVVSRTIARRGGYEINDNQELMALGAANLAAGCFQGLSVTGSASRTPVAEAAGGKTQVTGVVGAICIAVLLVFCPTLLQSVPNSMLAAVVISACLSLVDIRGIVNLYKVRPIELVSSVACFLGVALIGVVHGMFIAIGLAFLTFIWRAWRPYSAVLGRVNEMKGYHDISRHPDAKEIPGLVLFRWDAPMFFANARIFQECVRKAIADAPTPVIRVVIEAEPVTDIDSTAADALIQLENDLSEVGIELCFAQMKGPVKDQLKRYGLFDKIGAENFLPTLGQAVDEHVRRHHIEWHDWDGSKCCEYAPHSGPCPEKKRPEPRST